jgi:hypothetical protein
MLTGSHRLLLMGICSATGLFRNVKALARPSAWDELSGDGYLCPSHASRAFMLENAFRSIGVLDR